jgi:hypothetical protein
LPDLETRVAVIVGVPPHLLKIVRGLLDMNEKGKGKGDHMVFARLLAVYILGPLDTVVV